MQALEDAVRAYVALTFVVAGLGKLTSPAGFLVTSELSGNPLVRTPRILAAVPFVEMALGVAVLAEFVADAVSAGVALACALSFLVLQVRMGKELAASGRSYVCACLPSSRLITAGTRTMTALRVVLLLSAALLLVTSLSIDGPAASPSWSLRRTLLVLLGGVVVRVLVIHRRTLRSSVPYFLTRILRSAVHPSLVDPLDLFEARERRDGEQAVLLRS